MKPADISLANSKEPAIIITINASPANNLDNPNTEKYAAQDATNRADNPNKKVLNFITKYSQVLLRYQDLF